MSIANAVLKWAKKNVAHTGSGNEIFVSQQERYPHMHITNSYVGYSTRANHRRPLVDGDNIYKGTIKEVAEDAAGDAQAVAIYIRDTW